MAESIVKVYRDGNMVTFERFRQKTARGILNQYRKLWRDDSPFVELFFRDYHDADRIVIDAVRTYVELTSADFIAEMKKAG